VLKGNEESALNPLNCLGTVKHRRIKLRMDSISTSRVNFMQFIQQTQHKDLCR
jgi:hypothetical protein